MAAGVEVCMTHGRAEWHSWKIWMNGIVTCGRLWLVVWCHVAQSWAATWHHIIGCSFKIIGVHRVRPRDLHPHVNPCHSMHCQHAPLYSLLYMWV
jgi:hypothetical protein